MGFDVSTSSAPGPAPAVPSARPPHRRRARGGRPKRTTRLASPPAPSSRSIHRETNHRRPPLSTWNTSADSPGSGLVLGQGGRGASRRDRRRAPSRRVRARVSLSRPPTADRRPTRRPCFTTGLPLSSVNSMPSRIGTIYGTPRARFNEPSLVNLSGRVHGCPWSAARWSTGEILVENPFFEDLRDVAEGGRHR
jgi:hypothetical protein